MTVWLVDVSAGTSEALAPLGATAAAGGVDHLPDALGDDDVVVLGDDVADPVSAVRRIRRLQHDVGVVIVAPPGGLEELRQRLMFAPLLGRNVHCADGSDPAGLAETVALAAERARGERRRRAVAAHARDQLPGALAPVHPNGELLSRLLQYAPIGVVAVDADARIVVCNPRAAALLGLPQTAAIGLRLARWFPDPEALEQAIAAEDPSSTLRVAIGERWVDATATRLTHQRGGTRGLILLQDVTEQVRAEEDRRRLEAEVLQSRHLESLGLLAGGVAHDFNNLLTGVLGYTQLALQDVRSDGRAAHCLRQIEVAARQATDLTRAMLAYSGRGKLMIEAVDVSRLVGEIAQFFSAVISKKASLRYSLATDLPRVQADPAQLRQIVMNLVTNASEALEDRPGEIGIHTGLVALQPEELPRLGGDPLPGGDYVFVEVSDTGVGMDADTRSRIFDPFFTTKFTGRGLGLAAALGIVRGHRGSLVVESEPGRGSRFRVYLPADPEAATATSGASSAAVGSAPRAARVLVVDDEPAVRDVAKMVLEDHGLEAIVCDNGAEGVAIVRDRDDFDLVLLDLTMPVKSGAEALDEMRAVRPDLRIVLWSGYDEQEAHRRFTLHDIDGFLQKPFTPEQLRAVVDAALAGKRARPS